MKLYASKGEIVTCQNGHPICEVGRDIYFGQNQEKGHFINWKQKEPRIGGVIRPCVQCGAEFYKNNAISGGINVHFEGGWRISDA